MKDKVKRAIKILLIFQQIKRRFINKLKSINNLKEK